MREPTRLRDGEELPAALRDAFRALERDAPSAETVARVQQTLQALPTGVAAAAATSGAVSAGKLWLVSTLVAGSIASVLLVTRELPRKTAVQATGTAASAATRATATHEERTDVEARLLVPATDEAPALPARHVERDSVLEPPVRAIVQSQRAGKDGVLLSQRRVAKRSAARAVPPAAPDSVAIASADERAGQERDGTVSSVPANAPVSRPEEAGAAAHATEAEQLAQAKRLAPRDPESALRQIEALAQRYPNGTFVQERELLAIQLHQRLGHQVLVEQLARQFRERYPRSVYQSALPP